MATERVKPPTLPWAIDVTSFATHIVELDEGAFLLVITPAVGLGDGRASFMAPQIRVAFTAETWRQFKRGVEADGAATPLHIARRLPPEPTRETGRAG